MTTLSIVRNTWREQSPDQVQDISEVRAKLHTTNGHNLVLIVKSLFSWDAGFWILIRNEGGEQVFSSNRWMPRESVLEDLKPDYSHLMSTAESMLQLLNPEKNKSQ